MEVVIAGFDCSPAVSESGQEVFLRLFGKRFVDEAASNRVNYRIKANCAEYERA